MKNTKKNISIEKLHPFENHLKKLVDFRNMLLNAQSDV